MSTDGKQTAIGRLFKDGISSDQTQQSSLNAAEQTGGQNLNRSDRILQAALTQAPREALLCTALFFHIIIILA